jgi:hypothetical protein
MHPVQIQLMFLQHAIPEIHFSVIFLPATSMHKWSVPLDISYKFLF